MIKYQTSQKKTDSLSLQLDMPIAVFADDFVAHVFGGGTEFVFAVGTRRVERLHKNCVAIRERHVAVFALHLHAFVLRMDAQFFFAAWTENIVAFRRRSSDHGNLRKRYELGDFNTVFGQLVIEQRATGLTMNNSRWHVFTALRAGTTWPCTGHNRASFRSR